MLYFNSTDVSGGIEIIKTSVSKECHISHYWYFSVKGFNFQPDAFNRCHDILRMFT